VDSTLEGPKKALATVQNIADAALSVPGNTAKAVEESSTWLRNGLGKLQAAPQELGGKLSAPVVTTAAVVADTANAVVQASSRAPAAVKSRLVDEPVAAIQSAQDTVGKILGVPGKLISRTQDSLNAAEKVLGGVVALPGRLKDRVEGTVGSVQRASSNVASIPGQFSDDISSKVSRVQNAASGFAQSAEAILSFPGQTAAGIRKTIEDVGQTTESVVTGVGNVASGISNAIDGITKLPSQVQETASQLRGAVSIPGTQGSNK